MRVEYLDGIPWHSLADPEDEVRLQRLVLGLAGEKEFRRIYGETPSEVLRKEAEEVGRQIRLEAGSEEGGATPAFPPPKP